jgi:hypothetical protein
MASCNGYTIGIFSVLANRRLKMKKGHFALKDIHVTTIPLWLKIHEHLEADYPAHEIRSDIQLR